MTARMNHVALADLRLDDAADVIGRARQIAQDDRRDTPPGDEGQHHTRDHQHPPRGYECLTFGRRGVGTRRRTGGRIRAMFFSSHWPSCEGTRWQWRRTTKVSPAVLAAQLDTDETIRTLEHTSMVILGGATVNRFPDQKPRGM
jgi:hypothetical protein